MVIVKIGDGLGNQMYNYACGYASAKKNHDKLRLDTSECDNSNFRDYQLEKVFNVDCKDRISFSNRTVLHKILKRLWRDVFHHVIYENKNKFFSYDERVYRKRKFRNNYLYGYWQNYRYFDFCSADIRRQFTCAYEQDDSMKALINEFQCTNTCAVHIRGGDITGPSSHYFRRAIDLMNSGAEDISYIIFTNDQRRTEECIREWDDNVKIRFISDMGHFTDADEFFLMSACQNQIISNSTFSWWAAYLNKNESKKVIAPITKKELSIIYPEGWITI